MHTGPQKTFLKNHTITPSQAASHTLVEALRDERDWQKIDAVAVTLDELKGIEALRKSRERMTWVTLLRHWQNLKNFATNVTCFMSIE